MNELTQRLTFAWICAAHLSCAGSPVADEATSQPSVSVRTAAAWTGTARAWVVAEGTARAAQREYLTFEHPGRVEFIKPGLRIGSSVRAGELLARQDQREIHAEVLAAEAVLAEAGANVPVAEAELMQAQTEQEVARSNQERYGVLLEQNSASRQEYDQAVARLAQAEAAVTRARGRVTAAQTQVIAAQARLDQVRVADAARAIYAPIDGIAAYLNIEEGAYFTPSLIRTDSEQAALTSVPIVIIDPTAYEITVEVPAFERARVVPGQEAILVVSDEFGEAALGRLEQGRAENILPLAIPDEFKAFGAVDAVTPAVSPGGRSVQVEIRTTDGADRLQDGVFVTAWMATEARENAVLVPLGALVYRENQPVCFIVRDGRARRVEVVLGFQDFTAQEVLAGIQPGDAVVTEGRFQLTDGAPVRVLPANMAGGPPGERP